MNLEELMPNGEIIISGPIDDDCALKFRQQAMARFRTLQPGEPLIIRINSPGGSVYSMASIIETMDELPCLKVTVCMGHAMSAAALILSHGDLRYCGTHSHVMIHEVSSGTMGNVHDMMTDAIEMQRLNVYVNDLLAKNCGLKDYEELRSKFKQRDGRDWYMNAQEAMDFGIVDAIGMPAIQAITQFKAGRFELPKRIREKLETPIQNLYGKEGCGCEDDNSPISKETIDELEKALKAMDDVAPKKKKAKKKSRRK